MLRTLALSLALALGGCLAAEQPAATEELATGALAVEAPPSGPPLAVAAGEAPTWSKGDAWVIQPRGDEGDASSATLVVVEAGPDSYTIATTSARMAAFDAVFDVSYLGKIRARDLAGAQQGEPIVFFAFPLEDDKTWTTTWDGMGIALTAKATTRGFSIVGVDPEGAPYVEYDYAPDLRWWSRIEFAEGYGFTVARRVEDWTGTVAAATAKAVYERASPTPVASPFVDVFHVDEGQTMVMLSLLGGGSAYARAFQLVAPDGQPYLTESPNTETSASPRDVFVSEELPPMPGDWKLLSPIAHHPDAAFSVAVHQVMVEERVV